MKSIPMTAERQDWATPPEVFDPLNEEFGFELDACATDQNAKVDRYYTPEDNGLIKPWAPYRTWCNPPFGIHIGPWIKKAWWEFQKGATVVLLVPSRTDTRWWHEYCVQGEIRFVKGRIKFEGAPYTAPFPCSVVVFE